MVHKGRELHLFGRVCGGTRLLILKRVFLNPSMWWP
jgi:hypothetical protein